MPDLPRTRVQARSRRIPLLAGLFAWAISLSVLPASTSAQGVTANASSCAAETDPGRRLACYDRQFGRPPQTPAQAASKSKPVESPAATAAGAAAGSSSPTQTAGAVAAVAPAKAPRQDGGTPAPQRISARVTRIERSPNDMVLHLDNGDVWRQMQGASGDLTLRAGDTVTIEKHLGSYWLSSEHISSMRVRKE